MALISIDEVKDGVTLGLWKIEETEDQFFEMYPHLAPCREKLDEKFKFEGRKLEFLAIRALLYEITGDSDLIIRHNKAGKPLLEGWNISISHTKGWAVLILSQTRKVAIDIEYYSDRVSKIVSKFVRPDEDAPDVKNQLITWSAKETTYKYFSEDDLQFTDMKVFKINDGNCAVINFKQYESIPITYEINKDYVLTYTYSTK